MRVDTHAIAELRGTRGRSVRLGLEKGVVLRWDKDDDKRAFVDGVAAGERGQRTEEHRNTYVSHVLTFSWLERLRKRAGISRACTRICS